MDVMVLLDLCSRMELSMDFLNRTDLEEVVHGSKAISMLADLLSRMDL